MREIASGRRVVELPDGSKCVLRLPTNDEDNEGDIVLAAEIFALRRKGIPLLAEAAKQLEDVLDPERMQFILDSEELDWQAKANAVIQLLGTSPVAPLLNRTAEVKATNKRYRWLMAKCLETMDGKNWWDASPYGSYGSHPRDDIVEAVESAYIRFLRDVNDPLPLNELRRQQSTGDSGSVSAQLIQHMQDLSIRRLTD